MRKKALLFVMVAGLGLTACNDGKNPLEKRDSKELADWVYQKKTPALEQCSQVWIDQSGATETALENCEDTAESLATIMTEAGFGNIKADHVKLPTIWMAFNDRVQASNANRYDADKAREAMQLPKKTNKSRKEQEAEARAKALKALTPENQ
jgi:hypothetical protein